MEPISFKRAIQSQLPGCEGEARARVSFRFWWLGDPFQFAMNKRTTWCQWDRMLCARNSGSGPCSFKRKTPFSTAFRGVVSSCKPTCKMAMAVLILAGFFGSATSVTFRAKASPHTFAFPGDFEPPVDYGMQGDVSREQSCCRCLDKSGQSQHMKRIWLRFFPTNNQFQHLDWSQNQGALTRNGQPNKHKHKHKHERKHKHKHENKHEHENKHKTQTRKHTYENHKHTHKHRHRHKHKHTHTHNTHSHAHNTATQQHSNTATQQHSSAATQQHGNVTTVNTQTHTQPKRVPPQKSEPYHLTAKTVGRLKWRRDTSRQHMSDMAMKFPDRAQHTGWPFGFSLSTRGPMFSFRIRAVGNGARGRARK